MSNTGKRTKFLFFCVGSDILDAKSAKKSLMSDTVTSKYEILHGQNNSVTAGHKNLAAVTNSIDTLIRYLPYCFCIAPM